MTSADLVLVGSYNYGVVALSVLIAIMGSYAAIDLGGRVTFTRGRSRLAWLTGGCVAMGIGTWSMHYVGMLAFRLPISVQYDWPTSLLSLLPSVFASAIALFVVSGPAMGSLRALAGSFFMGVGISALHYIGMASMRMQAMCRYSPALVTLFGAARNSLFAALFMADVSFSSRGRRPEVAEGCKRTADGRRHLRYALHGHGLCQLFAL